MRVESALKYTPDNSPVLQQCYEIVNRPETRNNGCRVGLFCRSPTIFKIILSQPMLLVFPLTLCRNPQRFFQGLSDSISIIMLCACILVKVKPSEIAVCTDKPRKRRNLMRFAMSMPAGTTPKLPPFPDGRTVHLLAADADSHLAHWRTESEEEGEMTEYGLETLC